MPNGIRHFLAINYFFFYAIIKKAVGHFIGGNKLHDKICSHRYKEADYQSI